MHREIEKFISDCKEKMEKVGWSYRDLAKACGMHKESFSRILGPRRRNPAPSTIRKIAEALGVELPEAIICAPGTVIHTAEKPKEFTTGGIGQHIFGDKEKLSLSEMEEKMKKAMICFKQGVELLEGVDSAAEKAIKEIAERMRATSMLKESLEVFRKH